MAEPAGGSQTFRSLRHRNARIFFAGMLVSTIGTWLQITAMSLLVYRLTGRATDLGITVALQFLPMLVLGAWAGAVADRRDRRTMAIAHPGAARRAGPRARPARPRRPGQRARRVGAHARARRAQRLREPGPPRPRHRAGRARTTSSTPLAQHGGDDGVAHLRPGAGAVPGRVVGTGWCFLLNGVSYGAVLLSLLLLRPTNSTRRRARPRAASRSAMPWPSSGGAASCSSRSSSWPWSRRSPSTTACRSRSWPTHSGAARATSASCCR